MPDLLLELLSEEIPARMQAKARADLERLLTEQLRTAGLQAESIQTYATPRRLALIARGLPLGTPATAEELKGPRTSAPPQALEGFLRKTGLTADQLTDRDGIWFAVIDRPGRATTDLLAEAIAAIVRAFPWPKSMRWGAASISTESPRWVRPLQGVVAMLDEELIDFEIGDVRSSAATLGHRFHHPGRITLAGASDYVEKLRACHVIVDADERAALVRDGAAALAAEAGLALVADEGLVQENAGLTEWPVPLLGRFDPAFLQVPPEVIQLTMRTNQKYFAATDGQGSLAPAFICVANIAASDGGSRIVAGNQKVLAARLSDARFFWEQDLKVPLESQAQKLSQIVFHEKLGTVADRLQRFRGLIDDLAPAFPYEVEVARLAASLSKSDLVTGMVGEFPELQGLIGGYYAERQGKGTIVAAAVRDHYKPVGATDSLPENSVGVALALADKLDALVGFFGVGLPPSGSRDPFALRRSALGIIRLISEGGLRTSLGQLFDGAAQLFRNQGHQVENKRSELLDFFADRLKVQQREAGVRHDLIDAVFALGGEDDLVRLLARVRALQAFVETPEGADLLAGYKRAANILKKEGWRQEQDANKTLSYTPENEEAALMAALDSAEPQARAAVEREDFEGAMKALATLRSPVDAFFDKVTVNDPDPAKREARLHLLARMRAAVHSVSDFSKIEG